MPVKKVKIIPTLENKEAQAGKRDRFYFAAGSSLEQAETDVKIVKEGGSKKFDTMVININESNDEILSNDPFIYITCVEVDGAKDTGAAAEFIDDAALQVVKFLKKYIDKITKSELLGRCLKQGLDTIVNFFKNLFEDDLVGKEAVRISDKAGKRRITSTYKSPKDARLDYEYKVTYEVEFLV